MTDSTLVFLLYSPNSLKYCWYFPINSSISYAILPPDVNILKNSISLNEPFNILYASVS